jgi:hypothetical protein
VGDGWDNLSFMNSLNTTAKTMFHAAVATVSALFIAAAILFGAVALALTGLVIGLAGALTARTRPQRRPAVITLNAVRTGRGWSVDSSNR